MIDHEEPEGQPVNDGTDFFNINEIEDVPAEENKLLQEATAAAKTAVLNMDHRANQVELNRAECYIEANLVKRAKMLASMEAIKFVHYKRANQNDPENIGMRAKTDSLMNRHAVYDALFDFGSGKVPFPHYDTFRARLVDHEGQVFSARTLRTRDLVMALDKAGMENPSDKEVSDSLRSWALDHQRDSLAEFFEASMPEWDGKPRLDSLLIDLFKPTDTPMNRLFSKYFWLSLYNRVTNPGSQAPVVLSLIGSQDVGKSYFSVLLCRLLTGDHSIGPVKLDLGAKSYNTFLRAITGKSLVAVVGEMTGFKKGDMDRIKDFVTKTEDDLDFKFEDSIIKDRQWITIMDGNSYDGLQRDDTGNRRFYPVFCFQAPDDKGQPTWTKGQKVDFSNFKEDLWQAMAEARLWMSEHGERGYAELIADTNRKVGEFSTKEMDKGRGIAKDDNLDINLRNVMLSLDFRAMGQNASKQGLFVTSAQINERFMEMTRNTPYSKALSPRLKAMGFETWQSGNRGYIFDYENLGEDVSQHNMQNVLRHIMTYDDPNHEMSVAELDAEIAIIRKAGQGGGGF
jgi:hypothetical protein